MKKFLAILLIIFAILLIAQQITEQIVEPTANSSQPIISSFPEHGQAIAKYLASQKYFAWTTEENTKNVCVFENLGNTEDLFPLSLWVLCQEYKIVDGKIQTFSGVSGPVLIDYPNELSFFDIGKFSYQVPRDGTFYSQDIKDIFPKKIQDKILNYQQNINNLQQLFEQTVWNQENKILNPVEEEKADLIRLNSVHAGDYIQSPITIAGEARGTWFFEGDFPVVLTDWDGLIIAEGIAQAQSDWMVEDFVPFIVTLEFEKPTYKNNGALIFKKDNPSDLPENDDALEISIIFE